MNQLRSVLGLLVALLVLVTVVAEALRPLWPALLGLGALVFIYSIIFGRRPR